jgi:hypothetical protein
MLINQSILIFSHESNRILLNWNSNNRKVLSSLSNIRDKAVLITGASRGIWEIAELASRSAKLANNNPSQAILI